jgi:hypothetical protein
MRLLRGDDDDERVIEGGINWRLVRTGVNGLKNI